MENRNNCNIDIYSKNDVLYARFDIITKNGINILSALADLHSFAHSHASQQRKMNDLLHDKTHIYGINIIRNILKLSPKEPAGSNSLKGKLEVKQSLIQNELHSHLVITYQISNVPHIMIHWIIYFSIYINSLHKKSLEHIQFSDHASFEMLNNTSLIDYLFALENVHYCVIRHLMEKMLSFKTIASYQSALTDLEKIYVYYINSRKVDANKALLQCVSDQIRFDLLCSERFQHFTFLDHELIENKINILTLSLESKPVSQKLEDMFMLNLLNSKEKITFLSTCLGKLAYNNEKYKMSDSELMLIYFAEFYLFPNGRMAIINLDENPAYLDYYAIGKIKHGIFNDELQHLAKHLNVEFEFDGCFHKQKRIMFTIECSEQLACLGLHMNYRYSQDLLNAYHLWALFTRIKLAGNNLFSSLPTEVIDHILVNTNPSYQRYYHKNIHPFFFKAVNLGKERGSIAYKEVVNRINKM